MRLAARILALGVAGLFLISLVAGALFGDEPFAIEGMLLVIIVAVALAGGILSWWQERLAGILLVLAAVGMGIHIGAFAGRNHVFVWLVMGLPYLVAGLLFLNSWRLSRKAA